MSNLPSLLTSAIKQNDLFVRSALVSLSERLWGNTLAIEEGDPHAFGTGKPSKPGNILDGVLCRQKQALRSCHAARQDFFQNGMAHALGKPSIECSARNRQVVGNIANRDWPLAIRPNVVQRLADNGIVDVHSQIRRFPVPRRSAPTLLRDGWPLQR